MVRWYALPPAVLITILTCTAIVGLATTVELARWRPHGSRDDMPSLASDGS